MISPLAGKPAPESILANIPRLVTGYYVLEPDPAVPAQRVAFGTSGHRGTSLQCAFNEEHIVAITQAICIHRQQQRIDGVSNGYGIVEVDRGHHVNQRWSGSQEGSQDHRPVAGGRRQSRDRPKALNRCEFRCGHRR